MSELDDRLARQIHNRYLHSRHCGVLYLQRTDERTAQQLHAASRVSLRFEKGEGSLNDRIELLFKVIDQSCFPVIVYITNPKEFHTVHLQATKTYPNEFLATITDAMSDAYLRDALAAFNKNKGILLATFQAAIRLEHDLEAQIINFAIPGNVPGISSWDAWLTQSIWLSTKSSTPKMRKCTTLFDPTAQAAHEIAPKLVQVLAAKHVDIPPYIRDCALPDTGPKKLLPTNKRLLLKFRG